MAETYCFDDIRLDLGTYGLTKAGARVPVEPMVFDLLIHFARNANRILSRDDLIDAIWDGRFVSDSTVSTAIKMARKAIGDSGEAQRYIETVRGRGFKFTGDVNLESAAPDAAPSVAKIAIQPALKIEVVSPDQSWPTAQCQILAARLRTVLNRVPLLRISTSGLTDAADLHKAGVTHLATIVVSEAEGMLLSDAALVETGSGLQNWSRSYQLPSSGAVREVLLHKVVAHLEPALMRALVTAFSNMPGQNDPHAMTLEAIGTLSTWGWNRASFKQAGALLDQALAMDDENALAHAYAALIRALAHRVGVNRSPEILDAATRHAERALELEHQDSFVLGIAGCALCDAGHVDRGMPILQRSAQLDDSNGHALTAMGAALILRGQFEDASEKLREGIAISPADSRLAVWEALLAMTELAKGQLDEARAIAETAVSRDDRNYMSRLAACAINAARQDTKALSRSTAELLRVHPEMTEEEVTFFVGGDLLGPIWAAVQSIRAAEVETTQA